MNADLYFSGPTMYDRRQWMFLIQQQETMNTKKYCKRTLFFFLLALILLTISLYFNGQFFIMVGINLDWREIEIENGSRIILAFFPPYYNDILKNIKFDKCKQKNCSLTQDQGFHYRSSGVIMCERFVPMPLPPKLKGQIWIFHTDETPFHTNWQRVSPGYYEVFDYTMSYRSNHSRFPLPYGKIVNNKGKHKMDFENVFESKTKDVLWFNSNCDSRSQRMNYVNEMRKYIDVDVYGKCGTFKCGEPLVIDNDECHTNLTKQYKFYLAFENSICNEYVTEKTFHIFQHQMPIIPVVRSAPDVKSLVPNGTFINTREFKSPKALAKFLKGLGKDKIQYMTYLRNIRRYSSISQVELFQRNMCDLCDMLHKPYVHPHPVNIKKWINEVQCIQPQDIKDFYSLMDE